MSSSQTTMMTTQTQVCFVASYMKPPAYNIRFRNIRSIRSRLRPRRRVNLRPHRSLERHRSPKNTLEDCFRHIIYHQRNECGSYIRRKGYLGNCDERTIIGCSICACTGRGTAADGRGETKGIDARGCGRDDGGWRRSEACVVISMRDELRTMCTKWVSERFTRMGSGLHY